MEGVENGSLMDLNLSDAVVSLNQTKTIYKNSLPVISISQTKHCVNLKMQLDKKVEDEKIVFASSSMFKRNFIYCNSSC